jgi:hypothetical protein
VEKAIISLMVLFCFSLVVAVEPTYSQGDCVNLKTILNSSAVNISSVVYPDSTIEIIDSPMTKQGLNFNYTFCSTNQLGLYSFDYYDEQYNIYKDNFYITYSGKPIDDNTTRMNIFLVLSQNTKNDENRVIQISWLKYLRFIFLGVAYLCFTGVMFVSGSLGTLYLGGGIGQMINYISYIMMFATLPLAFIFFLKAIDEVIADTKLRKDLALGVDKEYDF